jgi:hypothetical protein
LMLSFSHDAETRAVAATASKQAILFINFIFLTFSRPTLWTDSWCPNH